MTLIKKDGFVVNIETGECIEEIYFGREKLSIERQQSSVPRLRTTKIGNEESSRTAHWRRLRKIDIVLEADARRIRDQHIYFSEMMEYFDLSGKLRQFVYEAVFYHKPKNIEDLVCLTYEVIKKHNIPITTVDFIVMVNKQFGNKNRKIKKLLKLEQRDYTWVIPEILSNIDGLTKEQKARIEMITIRNFEILKDDFPTPTTLMGTLTRMAVSPLFEYGQIPPMEIFHVSETTFFQQRKKIRELIKYKSSS